MRKWLFVILAMSFVNGNALAQVKNFYGGIIIGEPTGLSAKLWLNDSRALVSGIAWSIIDESSMHLHIDVIEHWFNIAEVDTGKLPFYFGIGGRVKLEKDKSRLGLRLPLGINYILDDIRLDFFFEMVPIMDITPKTEFNINAAIGIRYAIGNLNLGSK
jgi:hypothetical protein